MAAGSHSTSTCTSWGLKALRRAGKGEEEEEVEEEEAERVSLPLHVEDCRE
jgi:hypothetical protein